jgi:hypothetical protein
MVILSQSWRQEEEERGGCRMMRRKTLSMSGWWLRWWGAMTEEREQLYSFFFICVAVSDVKAVSCQDRLRTNINWKKTDRNKWLTAWFWNTPQAGR